MASRFFLLTLTLTLSLTLSSATRFLSDSKLAASSPIDQACKATRFPDTCKASLSNKTHDLPSDPSPLQTLQLALNVSFNGLKTAQNMVADILNSAAGSVNRTTGAKNCIINLQNSEYRILLSQDALKNGRTKTARAAMSSALIYQFDCWYAFKYANDTQLVISTMSFINDSLTVDTSNALSMIFSYENFGNDTKSWSPPKTERDGLWQVTLSNNSSSDYSVPKDLTVNVTVCKDDKTDCYRTIQAAVDAAPENSNEFFVIKINAGVYEEIVGIPLEKRNVVFLGEGMGKTVITGSLYVGLPGIGTYNSATVAVYGDGFMASGVTFENKAGPDAKQEVHQAVAFRSDSDRSIIEDCEFLGHQDTLYARSNRQLYKSCRIQGNVDFIFGNAAAMFDNCTILIESREVTPEKGEKNAVTAHGRTDPAQATGFVFRNCFINGTEEYMKLYKKDPKVHLNYLGRPWKEFSRTVFLNCSMEGLVSKEGWMPWSDQFALATLYYGEYGNSGPGADLAGRVKWSSEIPAEHVDAYSVQNFVQGDEWLVYN
ncbi:PREDICTED: probable pectinesterase/pectinesterase inhibitor 51 [Fragaria vesca subsp. vesca]|uniref:probable pectinesterase/pectinesterase inhibitor 51 n=1 Tax=Fragaria vesca subsp. vesca TaxID=101020 RepID=UPI0002C31697|nr:PREDICTED: probable pectinesterase/pectinesterase inhibitor 51 [Fragaria vesca subsp. vesca]